jgi:endonuclease/exonuclease/phosphatase family metal-dependent hydrolase
MLKLLTYNIRRGGTGREAALEAVIRASAPDLVVLQEASRPAVVARLAAATGMQAWGARAGQSLAFMSRAPVARFDWRKPRVSRHAFLEIVPDGIQCRIFGLHLSAVHAAWTERRRVFELRALLAAIAQHERGFHVLAGDFNTLAPGELLDIRKLPHRLRALVWLSGGRVRFRTIQEVINAGYVDAYRSRHSDVPGYTFPTWNPHVRLDYVFVPSGSLDRVASCEVVTGQGPAAASDHFPLAAEIELP